MLRWGLAQRMLPALEDAADERSELLGAAVRDGFVGPLRPGEERPQRLRLKPADGSKEREALDSGTMCLVRFAPRRMNYFSETVFMNRPETRRFGRTEDIELTEAELVQRVKSDEEVQVML